MFGESTSLGVVHYAVEQLFRDAKTFSAQDEMAISVCYLEVYNEGVNDLLHLKNEGNDLPLRESNGIFYTEGLTYKIVQSKEDIWDALKQGNQVKVMGNSSQNDKSSRSHTVFKITIAKRTQNGSCQVSELNIVDLAGAENLTYEFGHQQQAETKHVNLSLLALKGVVTALSNGDQYIPYRNSALTKLLQNSLGGNSRTTLLCMISPEAANEGMTKRTLLFGLVAERVTNTVVRETYSTGAASNSEKLKLKKESDVEHVKVNLKIQASAYIDNKNKAQAKSSESHSSTRIIDWRRGGECVPIYTSVQGDPANTVCLFLHAHGKNCSGKDFEHLFSPVAEAGYYVVGVDMPGFGDSGGDKASSRTEQATAKSGPVEVLGTVLDALGVTKTHPAVVIGYDWGASLALQLGKQDPRVRSVVAFHPSWTDKLSLLTAIKVPTRLLWVPQDQLHPYAQGKKMSRLLPNCDLYTLDIGPFHSDKSKGYYKCVQNQIVEHSLQWFSKSLTATKHKAKTQSGKKTANIAPISSTATSETCSESEGEEERLAHAVPLPEPTPALAALVTNPLRQQLISAEFELTSQRKNPKPNPQSQQGLTMNIPQDLSSLDSVVRARWAVGALKSHLMQGTAGELYRQYLSGGQQKSDVIRILSNLPILTPTTTAHELVDFGLWPSAPVGVDVLSTFPRYLKGRQVVVETTANPMVDPQDRDGQSYLCYDETKPKLPTYRASIQGEKEGHYLIEVDSLPGALEPTKTIVATTQSVWNANQPTNFSVDEQNRYVFEDGITCKYSDFLVRAKLVEAALAIAETGSTIDYTDCYQCGEQGYGEVCKTVEASCPVATKQKQCILGIRKVIDMIHCVHEGLDPKRSSIPSVGRLAHFGQGNCHGMASVMAAMLLPFSNSLGFEVRFREGFYMKTGRDVDESGNPVPGKWDGCPRTNLSDHTWLEVTLLPSLQSVVCDPSNHQIAVSLDEAYSRFGRRLPRLDVPPCGCAKPRPPAQPTFVTGMHVQHVDNLRTRTFWPRHVYPEAPKPKSHRWK
eukprot:GFYU01004794.1.p1 GENE.GFYU01004794.1~~GFYU01004794.1.p1  ORF type:complete len:1156 (-),score=124.84 GFYU01004794.1:52-3144(-)